MRPTLIKREYNYKLNVQPFVTPETFEMCDICMELVSMIGGSLNIRTFPHSGTSTAESLQYISSEQIKNPGLEMGTEVRDAMMACPKSCGALRLRA